MLLQVISPAFAGASSDVCSKFGLGLDVEASAAQRGAFFYLYRMQLNIRAETCYFCACRRSDLDLLTAHSPAAGH